MIKISILIPKIALFALKKIGRGSALPGTIAERLNKNILDAFDLPKKCIVVTGTNGKSTNAYLLKSMFEAEGYKVGYNYSGSNLKGGIITTLIENSNIFGKINSDVLVLEIDERYLKVLTPKLNPTTLIITSVSKDQPPRQGDTDHILSELRKGITKDTKIILNGDYPNLEYFNDLDNELYYFGINKKPNSYKFSLQDSLDYVYCPKCETKLKYNFVHHDFVGDYYCPKCNFKRPKLDISAEIKNNDIYINDKKLKNDYHIFNVYNILSTTLAASLEGLKESSIKNVIDNFKQDEEATLNIKNSKFIFYKSKTENCFSYNYSIKTIADYKAKSKRIIIGYNVISRRYTVSDISWLYDINFEQLSKIVEKVYIIGRFSNDIKKRFEYAGFNESNLILINDFREIAIDDGTFFSLLGPIYETKLKEFLND